MRQLNALGSFVYLICALVALLLLTRSRTPTAGSPPAGVGFQGIARDRLRRAEERRDAWWALLEVRLEEPGDLRDASSRQAFAHIAHLFSDGVTATLPASADLLRVDETTVVALLPGSPDSVRQSVTRVLQRLTEADAAQPIRGLRLAASVGWAEAEALGYDLDAMMAAAHAAALEAHELGGDQWVRATETGAIGA